MLKKQNKMDEIRYELYFDKKVIEQYKINEFLKPKNLGGGDLKNVSISDLRKKLDYCFIDIDSYSFKEKLIDFIEDFTVELRYRVSSQKRSIKLLRRKIKKLEKGNPPLNINNKADEVILNRINGLKWEFDQEIHILYYLLEQPYFLRNWASQKRIDFERIPKEERKEKKRNKKDIKKLIKKINEDYQIKNIPNKRDWHILIAPLVNGDISHLQGQAKKELTGKEFSEIIINNLKLDTKIESIRPYIQSTFVQTTNDAKDLYSENKVKVIYGLCKDYNLTIKDEAFNRRLERFNIE